MSVEFFRQEYWSGLLFPIPGDLPDPGIKPASLVSACIGRWILYHCITRASQFLFIVIGKNRQWCSLAEVHPALFGGRNVMRGPWVFTEFSKH